MDNSRDLRRGQSRLEKWIWESLSSHDPYSLEREWNYLGSLSSLETEERSKKRDKILVHFQPRRWGRTEGEWPVREEGKQERTGTREPREEMEMFHGGSQAMLPIIMTMLMTTSFSGPPGGMSLCSGDLLTSRWTTSFCSSSPLCLGSHHHPDLIWLQGCFLKSPSQIRKAASALKVWLDLSPVHREEDLAFLSPYALHSFPPLSSNILFLVL